MSEAQRDFRGVRQYGLWVALALTLAATLWMSATEEAASPDAGIAAPPRAKKARTAAPMPQGIELNMDALRRVPLDEPPGNLFNTGIADAEPVEMAPVPVEPVAEVPPLPFVYAGKLEEDGRYIVFLTSGGKNYSVQAGDVIDQWQVKSVRPPQMILSYLPLKSEVPLMIGEVN
ncbi:hypothetical protein MTYP_02563 [Methylophilaceae bacterium]|nr:hypothetical protein MTYP_02563 [Methylophilaceae bacterium]